MKPRIRIIAHRGLRAGPDTLLENNPHQVEKTLTDFDCEVDLWSVEGKLSLGHDRPQYPINLEWIRNQNGLWIHCKNYEAFQFCFEHSISRWLYSGSPNYPYRYFWHQTDQYTLTSDGNMWAYPTATPIKNAILAVPEVMYSKPEISQLLLKKEISGICTDYPFHYRTVLGSSLGEVRDSCLIL